MRIDDGRRTAFGNGLIPNVAVLTRLDQKGRSRIVFTTSSVSH